MSQPKWATAIQVLYRESPRIISEEIDKDHPFVTEGGLTQVEASKAFDSLDDWGLIEENPKDQAKTVDGEVVTIEKGYLLTKDGFEVAHERELSRKDHRINHTLVFFTFFLVLAQLLGVLPFNNSTKIAIGFTMAFCMAAAYAITEFYSS